MADSTARPDVIPGAIPGLISILRIPVATVEATYRADQKRSLRAQQVVHDAWPWAEER